MNKDNIVTNDVPPNPPPPPPPRIIEKDISFGAWVTKVISRIPKFDPTPITESFTPTEPLDTSNPPNGDEDDDYVNNESVNNGHNVTVFYDRKHNCEVTSDQLMSIKYMTTLATTEDDHESKIKTLLGAHDYTLGELGYKSPECNSVCNWDRWLNYTDLVFLRIEWSK
jgi:hypothetical protein